MQFLCLVYIAESKLDEMPKAEEQELIDDALDQDDVVRAGGHYVNSNALEFVAQAVTVRVREGKISVTDGPFAETKEQLGGYILIEAKDRDEAVRLAAGYPMARIGSIEVRPVRLLTHSKSRRER